MDYKPKIPQQKRGVATKRHIVETAIDLFSKKGYYNTSSNEISKQARVSIGCFYSYFKDKKQLFMESFDYYNELINKSMEEEFDIDLSNKEKIIYDFINNILRAHRFFPQFHQEISAMSILDTDVKELILKQEKEEVKRLGILLNKFGNEIRVENIEAASAIIYNAVERTVHSLLFSPSEIEEELLLKELANMILMYLF